jgi:hypothetical protein
MTPYESLCGINPDVTVTSYGGYTEHRHYGACPCSHCNQLTLNQLTRALKELQHEMRYLYQPMQYYYQYSSAVFDNGTKQLNSGEKEMNITAYSKLSKDQRALKKVGLVDENGNPTENGRKTLVDMLFNDPETQAKLVALAKEYKKDQKDD